MNKVIISGFLGKEVNLKYASGSGKAVANYQVAVQKYTKAGEKKEYDYINCVTWNQPAEFLANNQDKIRTVEIVGRLSTRNYEKDGRKVYITEVITEEVSVASWKDATSAPNGITKNDNSDNWSDMEIVDDSGDVPF